MHVSALGLLVTDDGHVPWLLLCLLYVRIPLSAVKSMRNLHESLMLNLLVLSLDSRIIMRFLTAIGLCAFVDFVRPSML